jgi:K+-transporting ATPase ATPase B chain
LSSLADDTPEGKSIVELAGIEVANKLSIEGATLIKFTAETRTSGVVLKTEPILEKVLRMQQKNIALKAEQFSRGYCTSSDCYLIKGGTPLVVVKCSIQGY